MRASLVRPERVFARAYERHAGDVYRYALAVLSDPEAAEQVTQTTFRAAYRELRGNGLELNALLAIAHEICRLRGDYERLAEADFVREEEVTTARDVRRALGRLAFDLRAVLVMREVEGRRFREIAEILELRAAAVETLLFRARRALREALNGSLTCNEAERAVSRWLDDRLSRSERRLLRAHLRSCEECDDFARSQEAQREALRALNAIPLPDALKSFARPQVFPT